MKNFLSLARNVECLAGLDAKTAQNAAQPSPRVEMDLIKIGDLVSFRALAGIAYDLGCKSQIDRRRVSEKDALPRLRQDPRVFEGPIIDELFARCQVKRQHVPVFCERHARMNAEKVVRLVKIRERFQPVHRVPIEQIAFVGEIPLELFQDERKIARVPHERPIILQEVVFMIARKEHCVLHGKEELQKAHGMPPFFDHVPAGDERIAARELHFLHEPQKELVFAVNVG